MSPIANTHLHLPPNFSAFRTAEDAVAAAAAEGVRVAGASNFFDHRVYGRFAAAARDAGIMPTFGLELITLDAASVAAGMKVNDPANPGRMYLCGKGAMLVPEAPREARAAIASVRAADETRSDAQVARLAVVVAERGMDLGIERTAIVRTVAERSGVPDAWVVLQERHIAMAVQEAVWCLAGERAANLQRLYEDVPGAVDDPVAVQAEVRARLLRSGGPAFVPESPVPFEQGYRLVLLARGIPCYPILADGATPICPFEDAPADLAARLLARGIYMAELIPARNNPAVVEAYTAALRAAGIAVLAGTEHNTLELLPIEPRCRGGAAIPDAARQVFWEGTCVVVAHQSRVAAGRAGFVDGDGVPDPAYASADERIRAYAAEGAAILGEEVTA